MQVKTGRYYLLLVIIILAATTALRLYDPFWVQALRLIAFDTYQRLAPLPYNADLPVRIVDIDEQSLALVGQWPWPRTKMADLLLALSEQGAAAVGFDVLFAEPDQTSPEVAALRLSPEQAPASRPEDGHDAVFAQAIAATPTVLAVALTNRSTDGQLEQKAGFATAGDDPRPFVHAFPGATSNLPKLDAAARGLGSINWLPDRDQVVRRVPLIYRQRDMFVPTLATEVLRVAQGASTYILKASNASGETAFGAETGLNHIKVGDIEIPTDADGGLWLRFRKSKTDAFIPAWEVLAGANDPDEVAGRIVLVGTSAPGLIDLRASPLDASMPGVEIHAQAVEHILSGATLTRPDYALASEIAAVLVLCLIISAALPRLSAASSAALGIAAVAAIIGIGWLAYRQAGLLVDPTYPALSVTALVGAATLHVYRRVEKQRGEVRRAFGFYVSPTVVDEIIADPARLELGGEVRELTLLFCDVRNFTSISEQMNAHELTHFINTLLTPLSAIILEQRGTIDKYMGDAIMAFWNAPLDDADHAVNACIAARRMIAGMVDLNQLWRKEAEAEGRAFHPVAIGIGINTGDCCVGNLGSEQRFDYSAIGDSVNVASRFEGLSKLYGLPVVVGEATVARMPAPRVIELDLIKVKGREEPTRVYTLTEALDAPASAIDDMLPHHATMLAEYRSRHWQEAEAALGACRALAVASFDSYFDLYQARIQAFRVTPPPADWDGSDMAATK